MKNNTAKKENMIQEILKKWGYVSTETLEKMSDKELKTMYKKVVTLWELNTEIDNFLIQVEKR